MKKYFNIFLLLISTFCFSNNINASSNEAILISGNEFNIKIKALSGDINPTYSTSNTSIIHFVRSNTLLITPSEENIISIENSVPVYAWFDNGTVYYYCELEKIYLNEDASKMFVYMTGVVDLDLECFDTSYATDTSAFFGNCNSLESLDLSNFNTSKVTTMKSMFYGCSSLTTLDLSSFDTSNVTTLQGMFYECSSLISLDLNNFNTSKVTTMKSVFGHCTSLESLYISEWDVSNVTIFMAMFAGHNHIGDMKITTLDLSKWDTSSAVDMGYMFYGMGSIEHLDIANWDVSNVTTFNHMFCDNNSLKSVDLSKWDTSSLKTTYNMFDDAFALETVGDISSWNTSNLIDANGMFNGCTSLEENGTIDLSKWDTSNLKTTGEMFRGVPAKIIDLSGWKLTSITNDSWDGAGSGIYDTYGNASNSAYIGMAGMFINMPNLEHIYVGSGFIIPEDVNTTKMFDGTNINSVTYRYKVSYKDYDDYDYYEENERVIFKSFTRPLYTLKGYMYNNIEYKKTDYLLMPNKDIELVVLWKFNNPQNTEYTFVNNYLIIGREKYNVNSLDLKLNSTYTVKVLGKTSGYLCTGDTVQVYLGNIKEAEYIIILKGDVNGDGEITPLDYVKVKNHIMETNIIYNNAYLYAADMNNDGNIEPLDYVKIKNYIMG